MPARDAKRELARRLPWLLVFRGGVATLLLVLTAIADVSDWPLRVLSEVMYGVAFGTYVVIFTLGMLLRQRVSPVILAAVHLGAAVAAAFMVGQATGGVESAFSFLYLLVVLDAAIIGGRRVALVVATVSSLAYGAQAFLQHGGVTAAAPPISSIKLIAVVLTHVAAFYLVGLLAGQLARLLQSAREAATSATIGLHRAEAYNAALLESLPVGVLAVAGDRVESANAAASRILESPVASLVGAVLPAALQQHLASGALAGEVSVPLGRGIRRLWVSRSPMLLSTSPDAAELQVLVLEDRTEVRALEEKLHAKERLASIGQMVAAMAHELRNPLAAISGSVELLSGDDGPGGDAAARRRLEAIVIREIERLDALISDLLVYARPSPPARALVDLTGLTHDLCTVLTRDAAWRDRDIAITAPERLEASVDAGHVRQMLWNLLRNALEASPAGEPVEVRLAPLEQDGRRWASIVIRDQGAGLAPELREHLFEPFCTTKRGGTGLGLAVVHSIVDAHGGSIDLQPAPGRGTEARVLLPVQG